MGQDMLKFIVLNKQENYLAFGSIVELGGLYRSRFSDHLLNEHEKEYKVIEEELEKNNKLLIKNIPLVLDTLYLLINEMSDGDFIALYDDVTKDDVRVLCNKLEKIYSENLTTL